MRRLFGGENGRLLQWTGSNVSGYCAILHDMESSHVDSVTLLVDFNYISVPSSGLKNAILFIA